ncbi:hypothetical protein Pla123a_47050 [Posidoniimonas polymericola]|uniref:Uncharacterized protein n=1 Tax=Posidoniimonas polymericola TaxID=2528002 RepID=A0A5C5XUR7_9BACT|nr:hypothetical protein [Posidoniimonas polymericola]TWT66311.1 hypothetical protein Pla123a_47050 [Posidoniimonas polymericola]
MNFRFSIRTALIGLTLGAGFSLVLAQAARGEDWALGVVIGAVALPAALLPCAAWTLVIRGTSALLAARATEPRTNPTDAPHPASD